MWAGAGIHSVLIFPVLENYLRIFCHVSSFPHVSQLTSVKLQQEAESKIWPVQTGRWKGLLYTQIWKSVNNGYVNFFFPSTSGKKNSHGKSIMLKHKGGGKRGKKSLRSDKWVWLRLPHTPGTYFSCEFSKYSWITYLPWKWQSFIEILLLELNVRSSYSSLHTAA